jgi:hypothetical protein
MEKLVRRPSASAADTQRQAVAKTPLGRIRDALHLGDIGRQLQKMGAHVREASGTRAR